MILEKNEEIVPQQNKKKLIMLLRFQRQQTKWSLSTHQHIYSYEQNKL